jgi:PAS domain S-box-containing protein
MKNLSREALEAIIPFIPTGVVVIEKANGKISYVNEKAISLYGVDPRGLELPEHSTKLMKLLTLSGEVYPPEQLPASRALLTGEEAKDELIIERPDGSRVIVEASAKPIKDGKGQVIAAVGIFDDITKRKKAEEALRSSEVRFRSLYENSFDAVLLTKPDGQILSANPAAQRMFCMTEEEIQKAGRKGIVIIDERAELALRERECTGKVKAEFTFKHKDGSTFEGEATSGLFTDADGTVKTSMIIRDITERKKAEESAMFQAQLLNLVGESVIVTNGEGTVIYWNQAAEDMYGWTRSEALGRYVVDVTIPTMSQKDANEIFQRLTMGQHWEGEYKVCRKDGTEFFIWAHDTPILDKNGKISAIIGVSIDITERKKAEEALKHSEERFRAVQENSLDRFTILKPFFNEQGEIVDFTFVYQNDRAAKLTKRKPEELVGLRMSEVYPTFPKTHFFSIYKRAYETKKIIEFEDHYQADKVDDWFFVTVNPISDGIAITTQIITKRKKAEEALRRSEAEFKTLAENAPDAIMRFDKNLRVLYLNPKDLAATGKRLEEFIGKTNEEMGMPLELCELWNGMFDRARVSRQVQRIEFSFETPNGIRVFSLRVAPEFDQDGSLVSFMGISRDITERKEAEEALSKAKMQYDLLFNSVTEGFANYKAVLDEKGKLRDLIVLDINRAGAEQSGVSREDQINHTWRQVWKSIPEEVFSIYQKVYETGKPYSFEHYSPITQRWYIITINKIEKEQFATTFFDVTQRKKAEEKLEKYAGNLEVLVRERTAKIESSALYARNLIEASPDPLVTINAKGKITDVNEATERITGFSRDQLIGSDFSNYFTEPEKARAGYRKAFTEGSVKDYPLAIMHRSGQISDVLYNAAVYRNQKGEIEGVFAAARDITERKKLEKQVQDSERLAAIGATAGMVGHDIRNPLQAITGDVFLAKSEIANTPDCEQKHLALESLEEIEKNIDYINKIVQDLQDYARPLNPKVEESDLRQIVESFFAKNGLPGNIAVDVQVGEDARKIRADAYYLNRILFNLVTNAVQAMPQGGKLKITSHKQGNETVITVADTGVGIPKAIQEKMFTLMFTTKSKGQGFGLPVVKRMTESLGGTVTFESEEGKGTKFIVRLPPPKELNGKWTYK